MVTGAGLNCRQSIVAVCTVFLFKIGFGRNLGRIFLLNRGPAFLKHNRLPKYSPRASKCPIFHKMQIRQLREISTSEGAILLLLLFAVGPPPPPPPLAPHHHLGDNKSSVYCRPSVRSGRPLLPPSLLGVSHGASKMDLWLSALIEYPKPHLRPSISHSQHID